MTSGPQTQPVVVIVAKPYDAQVMGDALAQAGYAVELTCFEDDPLAVIERTRPRAVVVSLRKTQRQGAELLPQLRSHEQASPAVLLVSETGGSGATPEEARALGADSLLLRPLDLARLTITLGELLAAPAPGALAAAASLDENEQEQEQEQEQFARAATVSLEGERDPPFGELTLEQRPALAISTPPLGVPRSGDLRLLDLPHLLQIIHQEGVTGHLRLRREQTAKAICFEGGEPVYASSNQPHDRLEALLYREGKITADQLARLQQQTGDRQQLNVLLVDEGHIKQKEFCPLLRRQVAEIIYSLFAWTEGEFQLDFEAPLPAELVRLELHPLELMLEGLRRKYSFERLQELVGPKDTRLVVHQSSLARFKRAGLSEQERRILDLLDGERTLAEIAATEGGDLKNVYLVAYATLAASAALLRGGGGQLELEPSGDERREEAVDRQRIQAKHTQVREGDYFSLLGLRPDAGEREIHLAYQRMRREYDPAQLPPELSEEYQRELQEITAVLEEAYLVLSNEKLRQAYSEHLS